MTSVKVTDAAQIEQLIAVLGDTPESAISQDRLRRGYGRGYIHGDLDSPRAIVMHSVFHPDEPIAFGHDAAAIHEVLDALPQWVCVNAPAVVAEELRGRLISASGHDWEPVEEIHYQMDRPVVPFSSPDVRLLASADAEKLEAATEAFGLHGWRFGSAEALLRDGIAAGAVVDDQIVAVAFSTAMTPRFGEIGVSTLSDHRERGYSTAAASLVAAEVQRRGLIPVWSTGAFNLASQRIAEKLGFVRVSHRVYLNPVH